MQAIPKSTGLVSPEEYLEGERFSDVRHEYVDGHVYAMAGASDDHNRIARNLGAQLLEGPESLLPLPGVRPDIPLRAVYDRTSALATSSLKPHRDQN